MLLPVWALAAQPGQFAPTVCEDIAEAAANENDRPYSIRDADLGYMSSRTYRVDGDFDVPTELYSTFDLEGAEKRWLDYVNGVEINGQRYEIYAAKEQGNFRNSGPATGRFVTAVFSEGRLQCIFANKVLEKVEAAKASRELADISNEYCAALINGQSGIVDPNISMSDSDWETLQPQISPHNRTYDFYRSRAWSWEWEKDRLDDRTALRLDIDGDGISENLVRVNFSPSTFACEVHFFDVVSDDLRSIGDRTKRETLLAAQGGEITHDDRLKLPCGSRIVIRDHDGRVFFETSTLPTIDGTQGAAIAPPGFGVFPSRNVRTIIAANPVDVCRSTGFSIQPVIVYDRRRKLDDNDE